MADLCNFLGEPLELCPDGWSCGGDCKAGARSPLASLSGPNLDFEAVSEVGHECMVFLPAFVDVFDQLLGPLLQDFFLRFDF